VLVLRSVPFPRTHNIGTLVDLLPGDLNLPGEVEEASSLTEYAVLTRYPGDFEPVTEKEYLEAIRIAEAVIQWAQKIVE